MTTIDQIPAALLEEIFLLLDTKSIGKSRAVSKFWCSKLTESHVLLKHAKKSSTKRVLFSNKQEYTTYLISDPLQEQEDMRIRRFLLPQSVIGTCRGLMLGVADDQSRFYLMNVTTGAMRVHPVRLYQHIFWPNNLYEFIAGYGFGCDDRTGAFKALCIGYWKKHVPGCLNLFDGRVMVAVYDLSNETRRLILQPYEDMTLVSFRGVVVNEKVVHWLMITEPGSIVRIVSFNLEDEIFGEVSLPEELVIPHERLSGYRLVEIGQHLGLYSVMPRKNILWLLEDYNDSSSWRKIAIRGINLRLNEPIDTTTTTTNGVIILGNEEQLRYYNIEERRVTANVEMPEAVNLLPVTGTFLETVISP